MVIALGLPVPRHATGVFIDDSSLSGSTAEGRGESEAREPIGQSSTEARSMLDRLLKSPPFEPEDVDARGDGHASGDAEGTE